MIEILFYFIFSLTKKGEKKRKRNLFEI